MANSLRTVADRRLRDAQASRMDVRGPLSKSIGQQSSEPTPKSDGLTRRERKIKAILLQELNQINGSTKTWAAYQERTYLTDSLDAAFIEREIATMEAALRRPPIALAVLSALWLVLAVVHAVEVVREGWTSSNALNMLVVVLGLASVGGTIYSKRKATQRRLWIYQALRELSDANDEGVHLDESVRLADLLIDRLIDAEEEAAPAPLRRIRS